MNSVAPEGLTGQIKGAFIETYFMIFITDKYKVLNPVVCQYMDNDVITLTSVLRFGTCTTYHPFFCRFSKFVMLIKNILDKTEKFNY